MSKANADSSKIGDEILLILGPRIMQQQFPALVRDVRAPKDPQRAMRLLMEELTRRVGSEFAVAIRTIARAADQAQAGEAKGILRALLSRLENLARIHHVLRAPEIRTAVDGCSFLRVLCEAMNLAGLSDTKIGLELPPEGFEMDSEQCWLLGIIVREFVTVAARCPFATAADRIGVAAARRGALIWCRVEHNRALSEDGCAERGMRLARAIARELHGEIEQYRRDSMYIATVTFPAVRAPDHALSCVRYRR